MTLRRDQNRLLDVVESFFREYLERTRGASRHTIFSYRDSLQLFFRYLSERKRGDVSRLRLDDITEMNVIGFLDHLESRRRNGVATRNSRLTALRSLCRYIIRRDPTHSAEYGRIVSISGKKAPQPVVAYLEPSEVKCLLSQPNKTTLLGLRDYVLIQFLYNTGVRISEALSLLVSDVELTSPWQANVMGKGQKARICPLWRSTARLLRSYIAAWHLRPQSRLFCNARHGPLTRSGAAYILDRHFDAAKRQHPALRAREITPHRLRHSAACALLQSGVDLSTIRDLLGHESVRTTGRYTKANLKTKRRALETFWNTVNLSDRMPRSWKPKPELLEFLASL
jgi:site-specific recombinase XerD